MMADRCRHCGQERTEAKACVNGHFIGVPINFSRTQEYTLQYFSRGLTEEKFAKEGLRYWPGTDQESMQWVLRWLERWGRNPLDPPPPSTPGNPLFD